MNRLLRIRATAGFALVDVMATLLLLGIATGVALPAFQDVTAGTSVGRAGRDVEQELRNARQKAVTSNRPVRVHFNCPAVGRYRTVELIGRPSRPAPEDEAADRCSEAAYPFPAADSDPQTLPNHDGPERALPDGVSFGTARSLEFWPDGSVHTEQDTTGPWPVASASGELITLKHDDLVQVVSVNGAGKIRLQH